jgi:hypothetical protein
MPFLCKVGKISITSSQGDRERSSPAFGEKIFPVIGHIEILGLGQAKADTSSATSGSIAPGAKREMTSL